MKECPDCKGELETGYYPDWAYGGSITPLKYTKGELLQPSGLNFYGQPRGIDDLRNVVVYRCLKCNRLFQYASDTTVNFSHAQRKGQMWSLIIAAVIIGLVFFFVLLLGGGH